MFGAWQANKLSRVDSVELAGGIICQGAGLRVTFDQTYYMNGSGIQVAWPSSGIKATLSLQRASGHGSIVVGSVNYRLKNGQSGNVSGGAVEHLMSKPNNGTLVTKQLGWWAPKLHRLIQQTAARNAANVSELFFLWDHEP